MLVNGQGFYFVRTFIPCWELSTQKYLSPVAKLNKNYTPANGIKFCLVYLSGHRHLREGPRCQKC